MLHVTLIGFGAIGRAVFARVTGLANLRVTQVVVSAKDVAQLQKEMDAGVGAGVAVRDRLSVPAAQPGVATVVLECAGHSALKTHVLQALESGQECGVLSVGALSEVGLPELLADAAVRGKTQVHLLAGAIGGIDAIAAARLAGLTHVTYTGRKPPSGWRGTPAEAVVSLENIAQSAIILEATAREAARLYPKNANVAATVSLAGLGLDATRVCLIADPTITENVHEIHVVGAFGEMRIEMRGKPLADNPKTSALTVLSALRFLHNRANPLTI
jgi:aspartate dehydrogenase